MSYQKLLNVLEPVEDGLFDSIIQSLESLPNADTEKWKTLAEKVADCQSKWNKWYEVYLGCEQVLAKESLWKGNGKYSYLFFLQTATELCTAVEARKDTPKKPWDRVAANKG